MLHVCYSNRFEVLCAPLAARIREAQARDPLTPIQIIVPNPTIEQFIRFEIAQTLGVASNLNVRLLNGFLKQCIESSETNMRVVERRDLQLYIYHRICDPEFLSENDLSAVERYLKAGGNDQNISVRALLLAGEISRLFEEYSFSRRDLLTSWNQGTTSFQTLEQAAWQRALWRSCFDDGFRLRDLASAPPSSGQLDLFSGKGRANLAPCMMLVDAIQTLGTDLRVPKEIHVFGQSYLASSFIEIYQMLAQRCEVYVYALNPCVEFWEDVRTSRLATLELEATQRSIDIDETTTSADDPFGLMNAQDNPALRLWGRPGREYIHLLNEATAGDFASGFIDPTADNDSLLARVQRDVLTRVPAMPGAVDEVPADHSIQIHIAPTLQREVEIVAGQIWQCIHEAQATGQPIRFHDIAVLLPDGDRTRYLPHIADLFAAHDQIPTQFLDHSVEHRGSILELMGYILDLPNQVIDHERMTRVLYHPKLKGSTPALRSLWTGWVNGLGVCYGASHADFEGTYLPPDAYHWNQALHRLIIGHLTETTETDTDSTTVNWFGRPYLPYSDSHNDREGLSCFVQTVRDLLADTAYLTDGQLNLRDWSRLLTRVAIRYVDTQTSGDEKLLNRCVAAFERLGQEQLEDRPVSFAVVRELVISDLRQLESTRSPHRADGVVISSLLPMRTLPFSAIFVLGLGANRFPNTEQPNPLDLRHQARRAGDVSPSERDRYLFLETLMAARDRLSLSYVGLDATKGEKLDASPVIKELEFVLKPYIGEDGVATLTTSHPLTTWQTSKPSGGAAPLASRFEGIAQLAQQMTRAELAESAMSPVRHMLDSLGAFGPPMEALDAANDAETTAHVNLGHIRRFLQSPLQASARDVLKLQASEQREAITSEPTTQDGLDRLGLLQKAFWAQATETTGIESLYERMARAALLSNRMPAGPFGEAVRNFDLAILEQWNAIVSDLIDRPLASFQRVALGPCRPAEVFDLKRPSIKLEIGPQDGVEISGILEPYDPGSATILSPTSTQRLADKHWVKSMLSIIYMSAAGLELPERIRVVIPSASGLPPFKHQRVYRVPPKDYARAWLSHMIKTMSGRFHAYRMPIETVYSWLNALETSPNAKPFIGPYQQTSDDYGPITELSDYDLPSLEEAELILAERFRILREMDER